MWALWASQRKTTRRPISLGYRAFQLVGWSMYFYAQASGEVIFASVPWRRAATLWGGICLMGIGFTHLLRWVSQRHSWLALPPAALLTRLVAGILLISLASFSSLLRCRNWWTTAPSCRYAPSCITGSP